MVPALKPVLVPLDGIPSFQRVSHTTQRGVSSLGGDAISPTVHVNDKDAKLCWSQGWSLRNATCHSSPLGHSDTDPTLSAIFQAIPYLLRGSSVRSTSLQVRGKDILWDSVICSAQIQVGDVNPTSLIQYYCNLVTEDHQICRHDFPLVKACWLSPINLFALCLSIISMIYWGEADWFISFSRCSLYLL